MSLGERIEALVQPAIEAMGFEIVRVLVSGQASPRVQVMVERGDGRPITVDDCAGVSRAVSAILDVEDPIAGAYTLEVSSPGIDRPLVKKRDFERFAGFEVRAETSRPLNGRRRFTGRLLGVEGEVVRIQADGDCFLLPLATIQRASLVITDDLMTASEGERGP